MKLTMTNEGTGTRGAAAACTEVNIQVRPATAALCPASERAVALPLVRAARPPLAIAARASALTVVCRRALHARVDIVPGLPRPSARRRPALHAGLVEVALVGASRAVGAEEGVLPVVVAAGGGVEGMRRAYFSTGL
jgi:hypothetical protein